MNKKIDAYIDSLLKSTPERPLWNIEIIKGNKKTSWNYIDGCMLSSLIPLVCHIQRLLLSKDMRHHKNHTYKVLLLLLFYQ